MASRFELQPLIRQEQTEKQRRDIARAVQGLIYLDTLRIGAGQTEALSIANPDSDNKVETQLGRLLSPTPGGTHYEGAWEDDQLVALVKRGPMLHGDLAPYREDEPTFAEKVAGRLRPDHGLHAFAVARRELARMTLAYVVAVTPPKKKIYVEAHVGDEWLNDALDEMEVPSDGPVAEKTIGSYTAQYRLRTISPRT